VPQFHQSATFLSVRADCLEMEKISKELEVKVFPTTLVMRGDKVVTRLEGGDRALDKLIRALQLEATEKDVAAHAQRRAAERRLRLEEQGLAEQGTCLPTLSFYY
jgi:hypothetical protein